MIPEPAAPAAPDAPALTLEHWIYGSVPEVGYTVRGQSAGLNLSFYARRLEGIYTPLAGESLHGDQVVVNVMMVHPASSGSELLVSRIGPGPVDEEYRRRTFVNHTAVVPTAAVKGGQLSLEENDRAIREYDGRQPDASGALDPLTVRRSDSTGGPTTPGAGIGRYLTPGSAETLLTRTLQEPDGRTLVLCRDSTADVRRATLIRILEALCLSCGLPFVSSLSDNPGGPVASRFQLVVAPRAFRTDNTWAFLDNALDAPTLPRIPEAQALYDALARCFQGAAGSP